MNIDVRSFAHLRLALGKSPIRVEVSEGTTVRSLMDALIAQYGADTEKALWTASDHTLKVSPVLNGKALPLDQELTDGMTVTFLSIVAAGA